MGTREIVIKRLPAFRYHRVRSGMQNQVDRRIPTDFAFQKPFLCLSNAVYLVQNKKMYRRADGPGHIFASIVQSFCCNLVVVTELLKNMDQKLNSL
jgi:hypothetical protein